MSEAATLEKAADKAPPEIRRFQLADLDRAGRWIVPRMAQAWPHLNERALVSFLRGILFSNEFLFLYQPHAVALAQVIGTHTLSPKPIVQERFVWVEDRANKEHIACAVLFYDRIREWAKGMQCETIIVEEMSDVPHDLIKDRLGRIFSREQKFARV